MTSIKEKVYHGGVQACMISGKNSNTGGLITRISQEHIDNGKVKTESELIKTHASDLTNPRIEGNIAFRFITEQETFTESTDDLLYEKVFFALQEDNPKSEVDTKLKITVSKN